MIGYDRIRYDAIAVSAERRIGVDEKEKNTKASSLPEWARMSDTEFFFRYLGDADEEELTEFLKMVPEFMEDIS